MTRSQVLSAEHAVRFDGGRHPRAKIGYVLLATEQTVEEDVMRLTPPGVGVHFTRAAIPDSITAETLADQARELGEAAALILPDGSLDVVCYACTSGSIVIGEERVFAELMRGAPGAKATSLITGVIRAFGRRRFTIEMKCRTEGARMWRSSCSRKCAQDANSWRM